MLDKVKLYLRVEKEFTEEDELIESLIAEGQSLLQKCNRLCAGGKQSDF